MKLFKASAAGGAARAEAVNQEKRRDRRNEGWDDDGWNDGWTDRSNGSKWIPGEYEAGVNHEAHTERSKSQSGAAGRPLPDYKHYELGRRAASLATAGGCALLYGVGCLFYRQPLLALLLVPGGLLAPRMLKNYLRSRRRRILNLQFKQTLFSLSSSLSAGRSVENSFREAVQDLKLLDPDGGGDMAAELNIICTRLEYGQAIEEALQDFSRRAGMEDIARFADVFSVCKRTGGDLIEVVRRTSTIIGEKLDIQQEIAVSVSQKKFESKALLVSPLVMLLFMNISAADYMQPMHTGIGLLISTLALAGLVLCYVWISRIMDIPL